MIEDIPIDRPLNTRNSGTLRSVKDNRRRDWVILNINSETVVGKTEGSIGNRDRVKVQHWRSANKSQNEAHQTTIIRCSGCQQRKGKNTTEGCHIIEDRNNLTCILRNAVKKIEDEQFKINVPLHMLAGHKTSNCTPDPTKESRLKNIQILDLDCAVIHK